MILIYPFHAAVPLTYQRAARMRRNLTPPEARLWRYLKGGNLGGAKFWRQHPVGVYILDFYCPAAKLAVEVDGAVHAIPEKILHDRRRTAGLEAQGIRVLRYPAITIRDELDGVLAGIREAVGRGL
ncbi:endonuclease domain-containing protein [Brevundimonas variabilis]|uniref:Very-short-patch-repair endonuclease n=1 Tax=Brevundimonas variabilis TaxID=74312 RepID=A0A7W9CHW6_9CAUL|nr:endonuclease domain-containing protein [Brevundimonas variabilis]MBB5745927.1 very-short-patch-repair endonuclease [Brevundimonas variabilis]